MTIRSFLGGIFIILGCTAAVLSVTAMLLSMQMNTGPGLLIGLAGAGGGLASLVGGGFVLLYQR